jgi:hypothetical protein
MKHDPRHRSELIGDEIANSQSQAKRKFFSICGASGEKFPQSRNRKQGKSAGMLLGDRSIAQKRFCLMIRNVVRERLIASTTFGLLIDFSHNNVILGSGRFNLYFTTKGSFVMEAITIVSAPNPHSDQTKTVPPRRQSVVRKVGTAGLRFGPVVTGQVAYGKDACGY